MFLKNDTHVINHAAKRPHSIILEENLISTYASFLMDMIAYTAENVIFHTYLYPPQRS